MRLTNLGICQVRSLVRHLRISESTVVSARAEEYAPALGFGLWSLFLVLGWRRPSKGPRKENDHTEKKTTITTEKSPHGWAGRVLF